MLSGRAIDLDRQIEAQLDTRKRQLQEINNKDDLSNWVFCLCEKCDADHSPLLGRLGLCALSTAYSHSKKYPARSAINRTSHVGYEEYCALYRSYLSGKVSGTGLPIDQFRLDQANRSEEQQQQVGAARAARPH